MWDNDMESSISAQRKKMHPYKFNLWVALAGIVMFFAGFTSAYIVMHARSSWHELRLPELFWFSTGVILVSSLTMQMAVKSFKDRYLQRYKLLITLTALLGLVFISTQSLGFLRMYQQGFSLSWNVSAALIYIIVGAHMLHVLGGVVALLILFFRAFRRKVRSYDAIPVEVAATYWHFVDILWIYLFIFFNVVK